MTQKLKTIADGDWVITVGGQRNYHERGKEIEEMYLKNGDMDRYKGEQI